MRKYLIGVVAIGSLAFAAVAVAANFQEIEGSISPKKLDPKKFKGVELSVTTTTGNQDDPAAAPSPATRALLKFKKSDFKFDTSEAKTCPDSKLTTGTVPTDAARAACKSALVGTGNGQVMALGKLWDAEVSAFNGEKDGKNPTLLLHTWAKDLNTSRVLTGVLKEGKKSYKLDVTIPPLGAGAAITLFHVDVKKGDYVQARCEDGKIKLASKFWYEDLSSLRASDAIKCKQA